MDKNRFIVVKTEGSPILGDGQRQIFVDRETGVNYLFVRNGYAGGLTPLLDADGKPVVTPVADIKTEQ
ncbi:MAG: DUF6440 family protein [Eubacteriales bacterium]